ncbi:S-adenosyl-L-methionine-dependent methyltransferase [Paraphaeosphaeria sporulosa]|uniref:S-adenosyl-L-methionine-dependent methyltransferase n=1 Tax=Paraphaeosphaeria sporulosa TaxID=1460663 RepID=A0A177CK39_9PLEO|nr:S-adenosyl-L-methionine-dependent methyltransferase [Paraphaeosphaeria sporulosa]OAG07853.1 S-adenosyl-L-methionine-dependent methyltransferase [Paraphaeosphaeria sporulosa]
MSSIQELSQRIATNSALVEKWLASKNAKMPSFKQDADDEFPDTDGYPEVEAARMAVIDDTSALHDLLLGPREVLARVWGAVNNGAQQVISRFKILQAIPLDGGATYAEISAKVGLNERKLKTVVRKAIVNRMLREDVPDHVVHTASSALLLREQYMMHYYGFFVEQMFPASAKLADALEKYQHSTAAQDTAFGLAFNTDETLFKYLENRPELMARFVGAMEGVNRDPSQSQKHVITGYSWAELGEATVVDVGGSSGFMSVELAKHYPKIKFVVQDYKNNVEEGAAKLPSELTDQVKFLPHNFFDPQPVVGAEVYILRHICHDWSAENSEKILRQIVPAMKPESKILLVEIVVSPTEKPMSSIAERYLRIRDLNMVQMLNAQERSESDWRDIVSAADSRLELTRIITPHGSTDSIIEISLRQS